MMVKRLLAIPVAAILSAGALQVDGRQSRPRIVGLAHVAVQTADLAKARLFYAGLLGYTEVRLAGRANAAVFAVNDRQRLIVHDGLPPDQDERLVNVGFEATDVAALREFLLARSVRVTDPVPDEEAGGRVVEVIDPDGHRVQFVELDRDRRRIAGAPDGRVARRILHAGLIVRDVTSADRFYKGLLTFSEIWRGGRADDVTSWINMRVPDGTDYLEYMLISGAVDRRQRGTLHHVALVVPDIQEALELVRSRVSPQDPNGSVTPQIGRNNRWQLNLYDPDGTRVELMEPWTVR
jgi:lactoylglutathione lyase